MVDSASIPRKRDVQTEDNRFNPQKNHKCDKNRGCTQSQTSEHLTNAVMFSPFDLPSGVILLVTDELASSADFFLHQSLVSHVKEKKGVKSIVLSISESLVRWQAVAAKSVRYTLGFVATFLMIPENVNVNQLCTTGNVQIIDVHTQILKGGSETLSLRPLYELIEADLPKESPGALVILDDISVLEWIGIPFNDIIRFCRALRALCMKVGVHIFGPMISCLKSALGSV
jgi:hypothetical protein